MKKCRRHPHGCGNVRKEGSTVDDVAREEEESWCAGEQCKQLQVAKVVRKDRRCERAPLHATKEARTAEGCLDPCSREGRIRTAKGCKGETRMQERWGKLRARRSETPEIKYRWKWRRMKWGRVRKRRERRRVNLRRRELQFVREFQDISVSQC